MFGWVIRYIVYDGDYSDRFPVYFEFMFVFLVMVRSRKFVLFSSVSSVYYQPHLLIYHHLRRN